MQEQKTKKSDYEHGIFLLSILRDHKATVKYYLSFTDGARFLAEDIYRFVLEPRGW